MIPDDSIREDTFRICYAPLPEAREILPFPGMTKRLVDLYHDVDNAKDEKDDEWTRLSVSGRKIKPLKCVSAAAVVVADLRAAMGGEPVLALQMGDDTRLWRLDHVDGRTCMHPIPGVSPAYGIPAAAGMPEIEQFVRQGLRQTPGARIVVGVKFRNAAFARWGDGLATRTVRINPGDPRWRLPFALDLSGIDYDPARVMRWRTMAAHILDGPESVEMMARVVAAPVAQPFMHAMAILNGSGGVGKGSILKAMAGLYGPLSGAFDLAALLGVAKISSTANEQAAASLTSRLFAYDSDAVDPGRGSLENLKKATVGECVTLRFLQQNVVQAPVSAFMVIATNHGTTLPSSPEWERRVWQVPFRSDVTQENVMEWRNYLRDGQHAEDGIIDALMAGAVSFAKGRPDPVTVNHVTQDLDEYGQTLLDLVMTDGPLQEDGIPEDPRIPVKHPDLVRIGEGRNDEIAQRAMMGLKAKTVYMRSTRERVHAIVIADRRRFEPFAQHWLHEHQKIEAEEAATDQAADDLTEQARQLLVDAVPINAPDGETGVSGQIFLLRSVVDMDGTLLTPRDSDWKGKGIVARWRDDASIRQDLRSCDPQAVGQRYGVSVASSLLVIDIDRVADEDGGLADFMRIPGITIDDLDTLVMRSPHGLHIVYRMPDEWVGHVKASTRVNSSSIDLRPGQKSYIVGPGSRGADEAGGTYYYPGIIHLPAPRTLTDGTQERRLLPLPACVAQWIKQGRCLDQQPATRPMSPASVSSVASSYRFSSVRPSATPYSDHGKHDGARDQAWGLAHRCAERGASQAEFDLCMDQVRENARDHDPKDTERLIKSAAEATRYAYCAA